MSAGNTQDLLRLRTDEELEGQNQGLQELKKIIEARGLNYFLSSGTLLGAVRDKDFIRWDWDVQFYLTTEDAYPVRNELLEDIKASGFAIRRFDSSRGNLKYALFKYNTIYELTAWQKKGDMRHRKDWRVPARFFESARTIEFRGAIYPCMSPPEEYLEFCYGDWRTPLRTADKDVYVNPVHFRKPPWLRKLRDHARDILRPSYRLLKKMTAGND